MIAKRRQCKKLIFTQSSITGKGQFTQNSSQQLERKFQISSKLPPASPFITNSLFISFIYLFEKKLCHLYFGHIYSLLEELTSSSLSDVNDSGSRCCGSSLLSLAIRIRSWWPQWGPWGTGRKVTSLQLPPVLSHESSSSCILNLHLLKCTLIRSIFLLIIQGVSN